jgi:hypothetical protein
MIARDSSEINGEGEGNPPPIEININIKYIIIFCCQIYYCFSYRFKKQK